MVEQLQTPKTEITHHLTDYFI